MSLMVNHNLMAMNAARNLGTIYDRLAQSTERLSSGLRVNSAADDAAGLAIREQMRSDIAVSEQGQRNASDAISMIQTAEGAMSVIDEKLIRMKELAEQSATGTYTTAQREIMNSEYQAMAAEIDRIANATNFNGVKLLDGSLSNQHSGSGMKIHFGTGNSASQDYYYVNMGDMRATAATGLRVGNSDLRETWRTTALNATSKTAKLDEAGMISTASYFGLQYSTSLDSSDQPNWAFYGYVEVNPTKDSLTDVVNAINQGTQATGSLTINSGGTALAGEKLTINGAVLTFSTADSSTITFNGTTGTIGIAGLTATSVAAQVVAAFDGAHTEFASSGIYAAQDGTTVHLISYNFGESGNAIGISGSTTGVSFSGATLSGGGQKVMTASAYYDEANNDYQLQLQMNHGGDAYQARIFMVSGTTDGGDVIGSTATVGYLGNLGQYAIPALADDADWDQAQNGAGRTTWDGADILTQSGAQLALAALDTAMGKKDTARASLGALQNRLENTITNLQIQSENLQAAESRISDVDVASEMTEFTKNNILAQSATAMLAQANSLPQLALSLLKG